MNKSGLWCVVLGAGEGGRVAKVRSPSSVNLFLNNKHLSSPKSAVVCFFFSGGGGGRGKGAAVPGIEIHATPALGCVVLFCSVLAVLCGIHGGEVLYRCGMLCIIVLCCVI